MKRWLAALVLLAGLLGGCKAEDQGMDRAMSLRQQLLSAQGCEFEAAITADYGDALYEFSMSCQAEQNGELRFQVVSPTSISGITGTLGSKGGALTFDDKALAFPMMADDQISPVGAPWVFYNTLRSGYLTSTADEDEYLRLTVDDSYDEEALQLEIWLSSQNVPVRAEILFDGRRILSLQISNFTIV